MKKRFITKARYSIYHILKKILRKNIEPYNVYCFKKEGGKIGVNCEVFSSVNFGSEPYLIEIGNNVRITESVKFFTHDGGFWVLRNLLPEMKNADKFGKIKICDNVHIGWNVMIMPGVTIGKNSVIGCGAIVTKDIPENSIAVGIPAKVIESIEDYYKKNRDKVFQTKALSSNDKKSFIINHWNDL